jgi:hypothetical protein
MKALKMILALVALTLLASCVSSPQSKPQTREELLAAGWQEVSAEKYWDKNSNGEFQQRFKPIELTGKIGLQNLTMGKDGKPEPRNKELSVPVSFEMEWLATFEVKYRSSKWPYTINKYEERWLKGDTLEIHHYRVTKAELDQLLVNSSSGIHYPATSHQDKFGYTVGLPVVTINRNTFLERIALEYTSQKQAYIEGRLTTSVWSASYEDQERQLIAAAILLGDPEFPKLIQARRQQSAEAVAREEARKQTLITTAFSGNTSFDTNHARNLSMLSNPSYWKKDTIYRGSFKYP